MEVDSDPVVAELHTENVCADKSDLEASENLLKLSKVDISTLKKVTQSLTFLSSDNDSRVQETRLVELSKDLVEHVEGGGSLTFRGNFDDFPVLCTDNETFSVREAETSNSLLLAPDLALGKSIESSDSPASRSLARLKIIAIHTKYYELKPVTKMKMAPLKEILEECPYKGPEKELDSTGKRYGISDLQELIQGSDAEILKAISSLPVCLIQGEYRWLDFDYLAQLLSDLMEILEEADWKLFPVDAVAGQMPPNNPRSVMEKFFSLFAVPVSENGETWALKENTVCRFLAEVLLRPARRFNFDDFMELWQQSVPIGMVVDLKQLEGMIIVNDTCRVKTVEYFPVEDLPEEPQERFDHLFRHRQRWKETEILPYLQDLASEKVKVGTLLTKYCRSSNLNGVKLYNARESAFSRGQ